MSVVCPDGHTSVSTDYCDVCGVPIPASAGASSGPGAGPGAGPAGGSTAGGSSSGPTPGPGAGPGAGGTLICPQCDELSPAGSLFCENCGYDFTTGTPAAPAGPRSALDIGNLDLGNLGAASGPVHVPGAPADPAEASPESGQVVVSPPPHHPGPGADGTTPGAAAASGNPTTGNPTTGTATTGGGLEAPAVPGPDAWLAEIWVDPDWYAHERPEDPMPSAGLPGLVRLRQRSLLVGRPSTSRGIHPDIDCGADAGVSRRHCQLSTDGQRWWVEDLQSANGTYVAAAGEPLPDAPVTPGQRREVADGDRIYLGGWTRLVVRRALPGEA